MIITHSLTKTCSITGINPSTCTTKRNAKVYTCIQLFSNMKGVGCVHILEYGVEICNICKLCKGDNNEAFNNSENFLVLRKGRLEGAGLTEIRLTTPKRILLQNKVKQTSTLFFCHCGILVSKFALLLLD